MRELVCKRGPRRTLRIKKSERGKCENPENVMFLGVISAVVAVATLPAEDPHHLSAQSSRSHEHSFLSLAFRSVGAETRGSRPQAAGGHQQRGTSRVNDRACPFLSWGFGRTKSGAAI